MKHIIVLEPSVANKIAAGEVVERPASIVKELVENSLDAGATAVTVEIRGGGIDYIRITDNGSGIPGEEVATAFMRHATSKLTTADELESIASFGFRGEALASIAAVSKVSMRTRTAEADFGTHIVIEGGKQTAYEPCACPVGTTIEVNELFYNVPARLKFIKNQRTEAAMIVDYVTRLMLANPDISIKLINNGHSALQTSGSGDLSGCIFAVYGGSVFNSLYEVSYDDGYIKLTGYVGGESIARSNRTQQSVFVNKRYIKSALISNAVQRAFLTRLMNHRFPFFVLNVVIASREVDVNVHPNKLSVRFRDEERVGSAVTRAIVDALNKPASAAIPGLDPVSGSFVLNVQDSQNEEEKPAFDAAKSDIETEVREIFKNRQENENLSADKSEFPPIEYKKTGYGLKDSGLTSVPDFDYKPKENLPELRPFPEQKEETHQELKPKIETFHVPDVQPEHVQQSKEKPEQLSLNTDSCRIIGTAFDTYIIVQQDDAIYYIDQHAAHERMRYEKLVAGKLRFDSQLLAVPMIVDLDAVSCSCVEENIERFVEFGYEIEIASETCIQVNAVPNIPGVGAERFLREAIDCVLDNAAANEVDLIRSRLIQLSCKGAVKAGDALDIRQLKAIVDAYSADSVPLTCPHGRPVLIRITKGDLQKMFKRII